MTPISRAAVIRALDRRLIEDIGVPSPVLMEHAGHLVTDAILARWPAPGRVAVLCGPGNNGGDGYVIARHLAVRGVSVTAVAVFPPGTPEAQVHARVCERLGLVGPWSGADLVVDAIFGTGQRAGPATLPAFTGIPVVAVDVPTGIDADTGARVAEFPAADLVVTIGRLKPFLFASPVPYALADIGLERVATDAPEAVRVDAVRLRPFSPADNKWDRGHVGVVAGSEELAGAGALAALGALRGGAGLVTLFVPRAAWGRLATLPPEIMVRERGDYSACDALVVGPGLGRSADGEARRIWREVAVPCVFDADGVRALDGAPSEHPRLLTPHAGEASSLLGAPWRELEGDRLQTARRLRAIAPAIYKGACPIVTGEPLRVFDGGLPQLGTGGSGDVLAGLCGALLARERPTDREGVEAVAVQAVWLHLRAGALAGPVGVGARDIADAIPRARVTLSPSPAR